MQNVGLALRPDIALRRVGKRATYFRDFVCLKTFLCWTTYNTSVTTSTLSIE